MILAGFELLSFPNWLFFLFSPPPLLAVNRNPTCFVLLADIFQPCRKSSIELKRMTLSDSEIRHMAHARRKRCDHDDSNNKMCQ